MQGEIILSHLRPDGIRVRAAYSGGRAIEIGVQGVLSLLDEGGQREKLAHWEEERLYSATGALLRHPWLVGDLTIYGRAAEEDLTGGVRLRSKKTRSATGVVSVTYTLHAADDSTVAKSSGTGWSFNGRWHDRLLLTALGQSLPLPPVAALGPRSRLSALAERAVSPV
jgi:hypothetical protein